MRFRNLITRNDPEGHHYAALQILYRTQNLEDGQLPSPSPLSSEEVGEVARLLDRAISLGSRGAEFTKAMTATTLDAQRAALESLARRGNARAYGSLALGTFNGIAGSQPPNRELGAAYALEGPGLETSSPPAFVVQHFSK